MRFLSKTRQLRAPPQRPGTRVFSAVRDLIASHIFPYSAMSVDTRVSPMTISQCYQHMAASPSGEAMGDTAAIRANTASIAPHMM